MLPAPARLSMITCCLKRVVSSAAMMRPMMSVLPPGGQGMMMRIGFSGHAAEQTPTTHDIARESTDCCNRCAARPMRIAPASLIHIDLSLSRRRCEAVLDHRLARAREWNRWQGCFEGYCAGDAIGLPF